jgi:hypothetical protein
LSEKPETVESKTTLESPKALLFAGLLLCALGLFNGEVIT